MQAKNGAWVCFLPFLYFFQELVKDHLKCHSYKSLYALSFFFLIFKLAKFCILD